MSIVGPRPERAVFEEFLKKTLPSIVMFAVKPEQQAGRKQRRI